MSHNLLKGKKGIIFGALDHNSIAWKTAERVHEEGGTFVLSNAPVAMRMGEIDKLAKSLGKRFNARFLLYPGQFDYFKKMYERLKNAGVRVAEFRNIIPPPGWNKSYTKQEKDQINWFRKKTGSYAQNLELTFDDNTSVITYPDQITINGWDKFKGWSCRAGILQIHIGPYGEVYRATCRAGGQIGSILDPDFKLPIEPITCPFETCIDYIDISTPKNA